MSYDPEHRMKVDLADSRSPFGETRRHSAPERLRTSFQLSQLSVKVFQGQFQLSAVTLITCVFQAIKELCPRQQERFSLRLLLPSALRRDYLRASILVGLGRTNLILHRLAIPSSGHTSIISRSEKGPFVRRTIDRRAGPHASIP